MRNLSLFFLIVFALPSIAVEPQYSLKAKGGVTSFFLEEQMLYAATDVGTIDVFDWRKRTLIKSIELPTIKDFMGDDIPPKIYAIDKCKDKMLAVSQGYRGFRNLYIIQNNKKEIFLDASLHKMMIKKASFVEEEKILIATLGNELMLFDLENREFIYKKHIGTSVFSDFDLNDDKSIVASADESGTVHLIDVKTGERIADLKGMNVDNIYQVVYSQNTVIGAGQDRRVSVYKVNPRSSYYLESSFLIYSAGLSSDGKWGAFSYGEENYVKVFNTDSKIEKALLKGQKSTLTQIEFVSENQIITSSDDPEILIWKWR